MSKKTKPWLEKKVDRVEQEDDEENQDTYKVKVNWPRIVLLGFFSSVVFVFIDIIVFLIFYYGVESELLFILDFTQYLLFGEAGLVMFVGACLGNFGQSAMISNLKERFFGSEPLSRDSFREATFNSFTYYFGGLFLIFYGLIFFQIEKLIVLL